MVAAQPLLRSGARSGNRPDRLRPLMSLVVVGSIAFDSVKTPFGERERMLGGSAVHFSLAASFFTEVRVVGPVGEDFGDDEYEVLHNRGVNTDEIERVEGGKTFFWSGNYEYDLNTAHTNDTQLGVFGEFDPKLSDDTKAADFLFLANIHPALQLQVRKACEGASFSGLDSMNLWIDSEREALEKAIGTVDLVFLNDAEIRMFARGAEPGEGRAQGDGDGPGRGGGEAGRVRRVAVRRRPLLRAARVPARDRPGPDRRRRLVRGRLPRLHGFARARTPSPTRPSFAAR